MVKAGLPQHGIRRLRHPNVGFAVPVRAARKNARLPLLRPGRDNSVVGVTKLMNPEPLAPQAALASAVDQRNVSPVSQIWWRMTAILRATATLAFFIPDRFAIRTPQAFSADHF